MNFRKISAAFLALTMTAAALPNVSAEYILTESSVLTGGAAVTNGEAAPASDFEYQANEDEASVTITKYKGNGGDVVIPSEIEGKKVTNIGSSAFKNCVTITSVTIPDGVTSIYSDFVDRCTALTTINVAEGNENYYSINGVLFSKGRRYAIYDGKTEFYDGEILLRYPEGKTDSDYRIPDKTTDIESSAFKANTHIANLRVSVGVKNIDGSAFISCPKLLSFTVDANNKKFYASKDVLYEHITFYDFDAHKDRQGYRIVKFPNGKSLQDNAIANHITHIGDYAFYGCSNSSASLTIPSSIVEIGRFAFGNCTSLEAINVNSENKKYSSKDGVLFAANEYAESYGKGGIGNIDNNLVLLQYPSGKKDAEYTVPDGVTDIGVCAFSGNTHLTSLKIAGSTESICSRAIEGCTSLTTIDISSSVSVISPFAFENCSSLTAINVDKNNKSFFSKNGVLFENGSFFAYYDPAIGVVNYNCILLRKFPAGKTDKTYTVPSDVGLIRNNAFLNSASLKSVTLPKDLIDVSYRDSVSDDHWDIGYDMLTSNWLNSCTSLTAIDVDKDNANYTSENGILFNKDKTTLIRYPAGKTDKSYKVPDSVKIIESFKGCSSLTSLTIPGSVSNMDEDAFEGCTSLTIYGYDKSFAQSYAKEKGIPFTIIGAVDEETGIMIETPDFAGKTLEVKTTSTTGTEITYDITLKDKDGNEIQPTGNVTVKIPLPEGWTNATVSRKEADGTFTDMKAVYENGYMVFTTDHFSEYVLKQKPAVTLGDLNDDEKININDVKIALRGALNNNTLTEEQKIAADVNEDTKVNISDVKIILKAALNGGTIGG